MSTENLEQLKAAVEQLKAAAHERLVALAWAFVQGRPPEPAEVSDAMAQAGIPWPEFQSIVQAAQEAWQAAQDMARVADAERELLDVQARLQSAVVERDKIIQRAEQKVAQLSDWATTLQATIRTARQRWAAAREKWPGPAGDEYRRAQRRVAELQGEISRREAEQREVADAIGARQAYVNTMGDMDATGVRKDAAAIEKLTQRAEALRAEIERLQEELRAAQAAAQKAERRLLELAGLPGGPA